MFRNCTVEDTDIEGSLIAEPDEARRIVNCTAEDTTYEGFLIAEREEEAQN